MDDYTTQSAGHARQSTGAKRLGSGSVTDEERELDTLYHKLHSATSRIGDLAEVASDLADRLFGGEPKAEKETSGRGERVGAVYSLQDSMTHHHAAIAALEHHIRRLERL